MSRKRETKLRFNNYFLIHSSLLSYMYDDHSDGCDGERTRWFDRGRGVRQATRRHGGCQPGGRPDGRRSGQVDTNICVITFPLEHLNVT
jgi:hypothetical protein